VDYPHLEDPLGIYIFIEYPEAAARASSADWGRKLGDAGARACSVFKLKNILQQIDRRVILSSTIFRSSMTAPPSWSGIFPTLQRRQYAALLPRGQSVL